MERLLGRYSVYAYEILRIITGLMLAMHGSQKLFGVPGNKPAEPIASLMGVAGVVELVTGVLVAVGLLTSIAAFIACGQMAVAYWMAHGTKSPLPIVNGGELAVLYCFIFLYIATRGAEMWGLDRILLEKKK